MLMTVFPIWCLLKVRTLWVLVITVSPIERRIKAKEVSGINISHTKGSSKNDCMKALKIKIKNIVINERKAIIKIEFPMILAIYSFSVLKKNFEITVGTEAPHKEFDNAR